MNPGRFEFRRQRLAGRLIIGIVFFSSLVTVLATSVQLWLEYSRDIKSINEKLDQVRESYLDAISENVWLVDTDRVDILLDGILKLRDIRFAEVVDGKGALMAVMGTQEQGFAFLSQSYDLTYVFRGKKQIIGRLTVGADMKAVYLRTLERGLVILGSNAIKTFLVGLFIFFFVYQLITRHIESLAVKARAYTLENLDEPWSIDRGEEGKRSDEFNDLIDAFNQMRINLRQSYKALEATNRGLEQRVEERTRELEKSRFLLIDAVESLADGFALFDSQERLVLCNRAHRKANEAIADILVPGTTAEEIVDALAVKGQYADAEGREAEWKAERMDRFRNPDGPWELRLPDGRVHLVREYKTRDNGRVVLRTDITDVKKAEKAATEAGQMLRDAIEALDDGFVYFDSDERMVLCNGAYRKINAIIADILVPGVKVEEIARTLLQRGVIEKAAGDHEAALARRLDLYRNPQGPWELLLTDGTTYLVSDFPTADGGRVVLRTDITKLKQAERELKAASDLNQRIIGESPIGITIFDNEGACIAANEAIAELIGATREQVLTQNFHRTKPWKDSGLLDAAVNALESSQKRRHEVHTITTFGKEVFLDCHLVPFSMNGAGHLMVTYSDVSQLKQVEKEVKMLSRVVEQSPNMVIVTNASGVIEYVNQTFVDVTGFNQEEALGETPALVSSANTSPETHQELWKTISGGDTWRAELEDRTKDGRPFWVATSISPIKDSKGQITHYVSQQQDITARKTAEQELQKAKEQAEIANRAKSELLANMSHELRTPLNAIIGFSSIIKEQAFGPIDNDHYKDYAKDINDSGVHLLELINDILDVSAIEAGKVELSIENVDFTDVVYASLRLIAPRAQKGEVILRNEVPDGLPLLRADERRLKQILINLLSNAVKFSDPGCVVSLSARLADSGAFVFEVSDQGIGMDDEDIRKALAPFGQADSGLNRKYEGTGLGLPLTIGLIELHGGSFLIDSKKEKGTTVVVTFPPSHVVVSNQATGVA